MGVSELENLRSLVDSSLRSPEYGIVNFHHLHKVLHGILSHLGLKYDGKDVEKEVKDYANANDISMAPRSDETERKKEDDDQEEAGKSDLSADKVTQKFDLQLIDEKTGANLEDQEVEK